MNTSDVEGRRSLKRIRWLGALFMAALVLSGATAIPIEAEVNWLVECTGARRLLEVPGSTQPPPAWAEWLCRVQTALHETNAKGSSLRSTPSADFSSSLPQALTARQLKAPCARLKDSTCEPLEST